MSTQIPGSQSFSRFLHPFVLAKLATSSLRVNKGTPMIVFIFGTILIVNVYPFSGFLKNRTLPIDNVSILN